MNFEPAYNRFSYRCLKLRARELVIYYVRFAYSERFHTDLYEEGRIRVIKKKIRKASYISILTRVFLKIAILYLSRFSYKLVFLSFIIKAEHSLLS